MCKPSYTASSRFVFVLSISAVLGACTTTPGPVTSVDRSGPELEAQAYVDSGDIRAAADIYADLYARSVGGERARYAIAAADLWLGDGAVEPAREWLQRAEADATAAQRAWIAALNADLALLVGDAATAIEWLDGIEAQNDAALTLRTMATRGRALFALGQVERAVETLVQRDLWLNRDEDILANHELIWEGLRSQPVLRPVVATGDRIVDGWLALLPIAIEARGNPYGLTESLDGWLAQYPRHPAVQLLLPQLREQERVAQTYPAQIALLLPLRSYQQPAAAIRDGFIAAYLQNPSGAATRLRIYDTDELGAQQAYLQAQLDGADFIVGPLVKTAVEQVAANSGFVPTLALNNVDNIAATLPPNFYQFGLAPEDEAAEIVHHAVSNGAQTAVALFPNSEWGLRVFDSFQRELAALGGHVLESRAYDGNTQDFSLAITTLLNLNDSSQRRERLAANLGTPIEFEPRRRQDVDMIFFAAEPRAARLLAPQFRFHFAGNLPTYATSDIYDTATRSDPDLNGIIFADAPLVLSPDGAAAALQESLRSYWPQRSSRWLKFYGFGFDAYRIIPMLYSGTPSFLALPGMSGELWIDGTGRVRRRLPVAQFVNGRPVRLTPAEPTETAPANLLSQR
jgi:hypothetical protein